MAENALVQKEQHRNELTPERTRNSVTFAPRVDIYENSDELTFFVDMPGVASDDVDIRFERDELVIHGKCAPRHGDGQPLLSEYGVGDFYRSFAIYEDIDRDKIDAELKNGVLTVHVPKSESVKPRRISVKSA